MATILSIESSTTVCSVAIHHQGQPVVSSETHIPQAASAQLAVMVDELFKRSGIPKNKLNAVAVSEGPGSYTGLRISVALAKGLCFSLGVPLISVNTLVLMSDYVRASGCPGLLCPMIDARRMEVYCLLVDQDDNNLRPTAATVVDEFTYKEELDKNTIYFFGNGAAKCESVINHAKAKFLKNIVPLASAMGELAFKKFQDQHVQNVVTFEPLYLKEFLVKKPKAKI
jgi:tRNA threonylcarbamoyladenosine biosynthesis protein TsaB